MVHTGKRKVKYARSMPSLTYSYFKWGTTPFCTAPWKNSKSDYQVLKAELLANDSKSIIGPGTFDPVCVMGSSPSSPRGGI